MTSYVIEGVPVSGKNKMQIAWHRGKPYIRISDRAGEWRMEAIRQLLEQRGRTKTLRGPVYVEYVAYQPADRCDIDNIENALFDALKKAKVIEDDKLIHDHRGRKTIDPDRPRIEISVRLL